MSRRSLQTAYAKRQRRLVAVHPRLVVFWSSRDPRETDPSELRTYWSTRMVGWRNFSDQIVGHRHVSVRQPHNSHATFGVTRLWTVVAFGTNSFSRN